MAVFSLMNDGTSPSLHNHSNLSDGKDTLSAMCQGARKAGIKVFGMSDHWVMPPCTGLDCCSWSMKLDALPDYVKCLQELKQHLDDDSFSLKIGLEVDYFHENIHEVRSILSQYPLDYVIGSVHYVGDFPIDASAALWENLTQKQIDNIWDMYFDKLLGAVRCGFFQLLGHIDLPKKFAFFPSTNQISRMTEVLKAVKEAGMVMEINTAGWYKPCAEPYPGLEILKIARSLQVPVVLSSDAHEVEHLTRGFQEAREFLHKAGYLRAENN